MITAILDRQIDPGFIAISVVSMWKLREIVSSASPYSIRVSHDLALDRIPIKKPDFLYLSNCIL